MAISQHYVDMMKLYYVEMGAYDESFMYFCVKYHK